MFFYRIRIFILNVYEPNCKGEQEEIGCCTCTSGTKKNFKGFQQKYQLTDDIIIVADDDDDTDNAVDSVQQTPNDKIPASINNDEKSEKNGKEKKGKPSRRRKRRRD